MYKQLIKNQAPCLNSTDEEESVHDASQAMCGPQVFLVVPLVHQRGALSCFRPKRSTRVQYRSCHLQCKKQLSRQKNDMLYC